MTALNDQIMSSGREGSAVDARRRRVTRQLEALRSRLVKKCPSHYASEGAYRRQSERTRELIRELEGELLILDCPGEYEELPSAVVADELGLRPDQIKSLIGLGEIKTVGTRDHKRVDRAELGRLAELGRETLLSLSRQGVEDIFIEAVGRLKGGDYSAAERAYNRIKARETCIGNFALALEIALNLANGSYEDAGRIINFILHEKLWDKDAICSHLGQVLRGARFKSNGSKGEVLRLVKQLDGDIIEVAKCAPKRDAIELATLYIAASVQGAVRGLIAENLSPQQCDELIRLVKDSIFTALYAQAHAGTSVTSREYVADMRRKIPHFWEPLKLLEEPNNE
jgi:hypothetical protein